MIVEYTFITTRWEVVNIPIFSTGRVTVVFCSFFENEQKKRGPLNQVDAALLIFNILIFSTGRVTVVFCSFFKTCCVTYILRERRPLKQAITGRPEYDDVVNTC
jgi:hypothetical protein